MNILVGVTGGIAAYKAANIVSLLRKKNHNVKVVMTKSATEIITPLALETLSRNKVYVDLWDKNRAWEVEHIELGTWADVILVAPATFNIVGKIANGIADDMLSTVISAFNKKVYFALAMNVNMYNNPILHENIEKLKKYNYHFIEAEEGFLACNVEAKGRLMEESKIVEIVTREKEEYLPLKGKKVLITAGPTREKIDPIRYLSNMSSGKMGYSLAIAARNLGAEVILVSGPTNLPYPSGVKTIPVESAVEMYTAAIEEFPTIDIGIACAAVADYRPKTFSNEKIKKKDGDLVIELQRNPDILYTMGQMKKHQILIGFAAETNNIEEYAKGKLEKKNLDAIVANHASAMQSDTNSVNIIFKDGSNTEILDIEKEKLAYKILEEILIK